MSFFKENKLVILIIALLGPIILFTPIPPLTLGSKSIPITPTQSLPSPTQVPTSTPTPGRSSSPVNGSWGVANQVDKDTYQMNVGSDPRMATPTEILDALNHYRQINGVGQLQWDNNLAQLAQQRVDYFASIGRLDSHTGFHDFLNNQNGFIKLGFQHVGENSSYGYQLLAVHLIEWLYASDLGHNNNQINPGFTSVGIGVNGTATDVVFGGSHY